MRHARARAAAGRGRGLVGLGRGAVAQCQWLSNTKRKYFNSATREHSPFVLLRDLSHASHMRHAVLHIHWPHPYLPATNNFCYVGRRSAHSPRPTYSCQVPSILGAVTGTGGTADDSADLERRHPVASAPKPQLLRRLASADSA